MRLRLIVFLTFSATGAFACLGACGLDVGGALQSDAGAPESGVFDVALLPIPDAAGIDRPPSPPPVADATAPPPSIDAAAPPPPVPDAADASPPPPPPPFDAAGCLFCNGQCVSSCTGCAAGQALCEATRTCGDCSTCVDDAGTDRPIECFECLDPDRKNPIGTCQPNDGNAYCLQGDTHSGYGHCECADAACPGATEVCMDLDVGINVCVTCGEDTQIGGRSTDKGTCQGGGACHANDKVPDCK